MLVMRIRFCFGNLLVPAAIRLFGLFPETAVCGQPWAPWRLSFLGDLIRLIFVSIWWNQPGVDCVLKAIPGNFWSLHEYVLSSLPILWMHAGQDGARCVMHVAEAGGPHSVLMPRWRCSNFLSVRSTAGRGKPSLYRPETGSIFEDISIMWYVLCWFLLGIFTSLISRSVLAS